MPTKAWNGSAWVEVASIKVWNGSAWVPVTNGNAWNGSGWSKFYPSVLITNQSATNNSKAGIGGSATATYRLASTGVARRTNTSGTLVDVSGEWLVSGTAADYEVRGTWSGTGGTIAGPTTWVSLGSTQDWTLTVSNNFQQRNLDVEIRVAATGTVADTATIEFSVDSAP